MTQSYIPNFIRQKVKRTAIAGEGKIIDVFAGFGGASLALEQAYGRDVDLAINHWDKAIEYHTRNHPGTKHEHSDVFEVDPASVQGEIEHAHFSPDCRHFSNAKGGTPVSAKVRALAWVIINWAKIKRPAIITLENVKEFKTWGPIIPLIKHGKPVMLPDGTSRFPFERNA